MASASHTIVIKSGESFTLPPGGELVFVSDPAGVTTDCGDVPNTTYKCGYFFINLDSSNPTLNSMDESTTYIRKVIIGGITYSINELLSIGNNPGLLANVATFNAHITDTGLFEFKGIARTELAERQYISLYFTVPETLYNDVEITLDNRGSRQYYKPIDATCGAYPAHTDTDVVYND